MRWYRRIAERRRPDHFGHLGMTWVIFASRWVTVGIVLRTLSSSNAPRAVVHSLRKILEGRMIDHQEVQPLTPARSPDSYQYLDSRNTVFDAMPVKQGDWLWRPKGLRWAVELYPPQNTGERIVDMPRWMAVEEVMTETEQQCWWLQILFHKESLR